MFRRKKQQRRSILIWDHLFLISRFLKLFTFGTMYMWRMRWSWPNLLRKWVGIDKGKGVKNSENSTNAICARSLLEHVQGQARAISEDLYISFLSITLSLRLLTTKYHLQVMESRLRLWLTQVVMVMCSSSVKNGILTDGLYVDSHEASRIIIIGGNRFC